VSDGAPGDPAQGNGAGPGRRRALRIAAALAATAAGYLFLAQLARADRLGLPILAGVAWLPHALIAAGRLVGSLVAGHPRTLQVLVVLVAAGGALAVFRTRRPTWRRNLPLFLAPALMLLSAVSLASRDLIGGFVASAAAAAMLLAAPKAESPPQPGREWIRLLLILVVMLGAVVRFWAIEEFPPGHPEHAAVHHAQLSIPYAEKLNVGLQTLDPGGLREIGQSIIHEQFGVSCLVMAIGFQLLGVSMGVSRLISAALGTLTLLLAFAVGRRVRDDRFGLTFAFLLAVSPWHLSQSRYGDAEHVLCPLVALAVVVVLIDALRHERWRDFLVGGAILGLCWYLYAATQVLVVIAGLAVLGTIAVNPSSLRRNAPRMAVALALFALVSYPTVLSFIDQARPLPVRSNYEDGQGLGFLSPERIKNMAGEEFRELFTQVDDPWFSKPGGGLGVTEVALLLPGLALCLAVRRGKRLGEALLLLAVLPITLLPGVLAPDPSFRRLPLAAATILFLAALVLWDLVGRLRAAGVPRGALVTGVALFAAGYAAVNTHIYFDLSHLDESESHQNDKEMTRVVAGALGARQVTIVVGDTADVGDQQSYLTLAAYDKLAALDAQGFRPERLYRIVTATEARAAMENLRTSKGSGLVFAKQTLISEPPERLDLPAMIAELFPAARPAVTRGPDGSGLFTTWAIGMKQ
jgi:hypothetical protein